MKSKRSYRRIDVKKVDVEALVDRALEVGADQVCVGLDVGKKEIVAAVRWSADCYERQLWKVQNPEEIGILIGLLNRLRKVRTSLRIGLESTGTYGDAVRRELTVGGFDVQRVSGNFVHAHAESFDGVPSQHDSKDALVIAELVALGRGAAWPFQERTETEQAMQYHVQRIDTYRRLKVMWVGRLEGLLARHWPELSRDLELTSSTLLQMVAYYGTPALLVADSEAQNRLARWGGSGLKRNKIEQILETAKVSVGIPANALQRQWLQEVSGEVQRLEGEARKSEKELQQLMRQYDEFQYLREIQTTTLCVLWSQVGNPGQYASAGAYIKAMGLNLREYSSGLHHGQRSISKRGSSMARRWLYFLALRAIREPRLSPWYQARIEGGMSKLGGEAGVTTANPRKMKTIVAVMRKLCRCIWHCVRYKVEFDWAKVFPGKPLGCASSPEEAAATDAPVSGARRAAPGRQELASA